MSTVTQLSVPARVEQAVIATGNMEQLLPSVYKWAASRFIARAKIYIATCKQSEKIQKCSVGSIVKAILQGAEYGIPIDGRMGHLVPYGTEAVFMPDYKGLIAVGRRHGAFVDAYARIVYQNDEFSYSMTDGQWQINHVPKLTERGAIIGAYAVVVFEQGRFVVEWMEKSDIEAIRSRSKAGTSGPWVTDWSEMAKKTVIRRAIKTYSDDPELLSLIEQDDRAVGLAAEIVQQPKRIALDDLAARIEGKTVIEQLPEAEALPDRLARCTTVEQVDAVEQELAATWDKSDLDGLAFECSERRKMLV